MLTDLKRYEIEFCSCCGYSSIVCENTTITITPFALCYSGWSDMRVTGALKLIWRRSRLYWRALVVLDVLEASKSTEPKYISRNQCGIHSLYSQYLTIDITVVYHLPILLDEETMTAKNNSEEMRRKSHRSNWNQSGSSTHKHTNIPIGRCVCEIVNNNKNTCDKSIWLHTFE